MKLPAGVAVVTLFIVGTFVVLALQVQRQHQTLQIVRSAALFSDTIKSSTYHFMLEDRRPEVYRIMETIGRQDGVEKVRIFNKDGQITFSTEHGETGGFVNKRAESCYACHATDQPIERLALASRSRVYQLNGHRILGMVTPIYNEPGCSAAPCHAHPGEKRVLGVVDIGLSLATMDAGMADLERRTIMLSTAALLALAGIVAVLSRRLLVTPVRELLRGTQRVSRGDLEHQIPVHAPDEIGVLAGSFNQMTGSLRQAQAEIRSLMDGLERQVEERTAALRAAQNQLIQSEKMVSLGKLSASIAHEINNPLAGILTYAKLLSRTIAEGPLDERARTAFVRHLGLVQRETQRCTAIVRSLLDFARQREPALKPIDVNACVEEALSLFANQFTIQGIALTRRLGTLPAVKADFGQVRQVFVNVILNACEAMPAGGTLTVESRAAAAGPAVEVVVSDSGSGIAPEHLSKIVDPFFTTKDKGTGLGLSVVYGVLEGHGGKLEIQSEIGQGTSVLIRLPAATGE